MKKQEAIQLIESTFNNAFDENQFTLFIKNFLNDIDTTKYNEYKGNYIKDAYTEHINQYKRIGKYIDPDGEALDVLIVEVKDQSKLDRARTTLRNFIITHLDNFEKDHALVAFYSKSDGGADWRFSYVKLEYKTEVTEGKLKQKKELTPAKRYSFLVGEHERGHTAKTQLLPLLQNVYNNPTLAQIEETFSIEAVTDEFFEQYKLLFGKLVEQFEKDKALQAELERSEIKTDRFAKKLLGQIVFLYFLQKKGWLGVPKDEKWGKGDKRFLQSLYDKAINEDKNFYGDYLQYLFYEALAKEHNDEGVKGYYAKLNSRIPFLNGGLFEADYQWETANISIPNYLFRNDEKLKSGDEGTGILDVFDRYNFTIKEDEPLEKEVAVDPEMLGKVFENMLEVTERKSKGAFYTPREIVHYMCQESLIHYLDNSINGHSDAKPKVSVEDLEEFIRKGFFSLENDLRVLKEGKETKTYKFQLPESIRNHAEELDKCISNIKICDPAIGSGAFPVGLLLELVNAQLVLRQYLSPKYFDKKLKELELTQREFEENESRYTYRLKRHAIQESIYGVDVDASAIDVARLRLWLSLVVDEEDLDNIEALPNLDYKIVWGDSIVGLPENAMRNLKVQAELELLKELFFKETDETTKKELRRNINSKIEQLLKSAEEFSGYSIDFDFKLYFSEVWNEKNGFDIVIGNPPYVDIKQLDKTLVKYLFENYLTAENRVNLYSSFIEKGKSLLNENGCLTYINPNSMLLNSSYKKLRGYVANGIDLIIKLPNRIFKKAIVETIIIKVAASNSTKKVKGAWYKHNDIIDFNDLSFYEFEIQNWKNNEEFKFNIFTTPSQGEILSKISSGKNKIRRDFDFCLGVTPYDKYKGHSQSDIKNKVFHSNEKLNSEYVPLISGKDIQKYFVSGRNIKEYLRYGPWLGAPRQEKFFTEPRVIVRQIVSGTPPKIYAGYTSESLYHTQIGFSILHRKGDIEQIKGLCCILNSDTMNFYHAYLYLDIEKDTFQKILIENCKDFPIPDLNDLNFKRTASTLLDSIIFLKNNSSSNLLIKYYEDIANAIVYELYFPNETKSAGKEILEHLQDLKPISDGMTEEQKLSIIQGEFERLYDPNHPVRNAVETMDSIEEIKIIKEALKI